MVQYQCLIHPRWEVSSLFEMKISLEDMIHQFINVLGKPLCNSKEIMMLLPLKPLNKLCASTWSRGSCWALLISLPQKLYFIFKRLVSFLFTFDSISIPVVVQLRSCLTFYSSPFKMDYHLDFYPLVVLKVLSIGFINNMFYEGVYGIKIL